MALAVETLMLELQTRFVNMQASNLYIVVDKDMSLYFNWSRWN